MRVVETTTMRLVVCVDGQQQKEQVQHVHLVVAADVVVVVVGSFASPRGYFSLVDCSVLDLAFLRYQSS